MHDPKPVGARNLIISPDTTFHLSNGLERRLRSYSYGTVRSTCNLLFPQGHYLQRERKGIVYRECIPLQLCALAAPLPTAATGRRPSWPLDSCTEISSTRRRKRPSVPLAYRKRLPNCLRTTRSMSI